MQQEFRFVGAVSNVGLVRMDRFGVKYRMEEEVAEDAIRGGAALLPEAKFAEIGFTTEDLKIWADPFCQLGDIPADKREAASKAAFLAKRAEAQQAFCNLRHELLPPESKPNIETATDEAPAITIAEEVSNG